MKTLNMPCIIALVATLTCCGRIEAQINSNLWNNPAFQKRLMGSFGFDAAVEPSLSENEEADYEQVIPLLESDPDKALDYFIQLRDLPNSSPRFDFLIGNIYFQKDQKAAAIESFRKAIEKFPSYRQAHNNLGILYSQTGQYREAVRHLTEAIRLGSADGTSYGLLGIAFVSLENYIAAEEAFRSAMVLSPEVKDWEMGLIRALYSQEKFTDVISIMDRMIRQNPTDENLWLLQANAFLGRKDALSAAANYEVLDQLGKLPVAALNTLGDIYVNESLLESAASAYLRAYEKDSASGVSGPLRAAEILLSREGYRSARNLLQSARKRSGDSLTPDDRKKMLKLEAKIGMAEGKAGESAKLLEQVVQMDPLDGDSLIMLGQYYQNESDPEKAIFYFENAASIEAFEADAKTRHAQLLVGQGKYELAVPLLKRAQDIKPRDSVARFLEDLERFLKARR